MNVIALGNEDKKLLMDLYDDPKILHSLDSLNFLKCDQLNYLNFECQQYDNRVISIEQEWLDKDTNLNHYDDIYKIKLYEVSLMELLILLSFYVTKNQSEVNHLIKLQPNPTFFYKTFLELDCSNFVSILSFDSQSMAQLLSSKNS